MPSTISRRSFLKNSAAFAAVSTVEAAGVVSARALAKDSVPSNRVNLALIGARNMGWQDLENMLKAGGTRCVAICDVDEAVLESRKAELARKYHPLPPDFLATGDYRRILDRKDVDAVLIGTPDHWHCLQFSDACKAGKDVYVQKPLANSFDECGVMVEMARRHDRVVQVGQQQRGDPCWQGLVSFIQDGGLGRVTRVDAWANFDYAAQLPAPPDSAPPPRVDYDTWLGPAPARPFNKLHFHGSWRCFWNYGGGLMSDWGVHLLDIALWATNTRTLPLRASAIGGKFAAPNGAHETFDTLSAAWEYEKFLLTWSNSTLLQRGPFGKSYGLAFWGEKGLVVANRSGWDFYKGTAENPERSERGDGMENKTALIRHAANFLDCVRRHDIQTNCPVETGALCSRLAHLGNISARLGGTPILCQENALKNPSPEVLALARPAYRAPWKFPTI
ncbi:MAG: Gfo/Idh/MocA family oxidoreductase [Puniceicoccales bacterium]|jgi:predicted dehydrogenase|nr:Gfo/Idh/MocA family oxidoreductase [Puniceicoccales bacterium]